MTVNILLTIIILTRNHPRYIQRIIEHLDGSAFRPQMIVLDSSDDCLTEEIVGRADSSWWKYRRVDPSWTADQKTIYALKCFDTKYLWIVGDGLLPELDAIRDEIVCAETKGCQCIHLANQDARDVRRYFASQMLPDTCVYEDAPGFFKDFFWTATFMGATIIDRELAQAILMCKGLPFYMESGFAFACAMFESLSEMPFRAMVRKIHYYVPNPEKKEAIWMSSGMIFRIWAKQMPETIRRMPPEFDAYKEYVIATTCANNNYLSIRGLIRWRSRGQYNLAVMQSYKKELMDTTQFSAWKLRLIAMLPVFICKLIYMPFAIRNRLKQIMKQ